MSIYDSLNDCQQEAVYTTQGPLLVLAGAGSGKTRVLTHRIAYLIEEMDVNPWNILAITFTNKAANEMRERVDNIVDTGADVWVSTFHSMCVRILRRYIDRMGYDTNFTIYDTDDQKSVIKECCKKLNIDTTKFKAGNILGAISSAKNEGQTPDELELSDPSDYVVKTVAKVYREYQKQLKLNNALDFDDLLLITVELFRSCKDVLEYYQERFKYIMVDEYQDTNAVQFNLVSLLAGKYRNLCVVGDDDQSIYKFRGADIRNILDFEKIYPDATVIRLEENYRSTQNILNAANEVIRNNVGRKSKTLWTGNDDGEQVTVDFYQDAYQEAEKIALDIRSKVRDGWNHNDIAILYRTNAQSRILEEKLINYNIPYRIYGGVNFYQRREIKDILAYLKTLDNGRDGQAVKRIINVPKRGIGATTIAKVQELADSLGISFWEGLVQATRLDSFKRSAGKLEPFVNYMLALKARMQAMSLEELVETIIEETGYIAYLSESETKAEVEARQENIAEFINKVVSYEENCEGEPSLGEFLEEVALVADIDNMDSDADNVSLMTLHSAKGLEFPIVYMTGLEEGLFPSYMSIEAGSAELEEERRLCYVGITRAKKELHITGAKVRMIHGENRINRMSRFVKELPREINVNESSSSAYKDEPVEFNRKFKSVPAFGGAFSNPYNTNNTSTAGMQTGAQLFAKADGASLEYGVGDRVSHVKFGNGTVQEIKDGGRDFEVAVNFDDVGIRRLFASFAKLKKI